MKIEVDVLNLDVVKEALKKSALTWTKEMPKVTGFYWFRVATFPERSLQIIRIVSGELDRECAKGGAYDHKDNEWAGPIPLPMEANE